jgi:hypothetical protein
MNKRCDPVDRNVRHRANGSDGVLPSAAVDEARAAPRIARVAQSAAGRGADTGHDPDEAGINHQHYARDAAPGFSSAGRKYSYCLPHEMGQMFSKVLITTIVHSRLLSFCCFSVYYVTSFCFVTPDR